LNFYISFWLVSDFLHTNWVSNCTHQFCSFNVSFFFLHFFDEDVFSYLFDTLVGNNISMPWLEKKNESW